MKVIKDKAFKKTIIARKWAKHQKQKQVFRWLKILSEQRLRQKRLQKKESEIYSLFQLKKYVKAWRFVVNSQAKVGAIGEHKVSQQQTFCVKYSEFCKCVKCEHTRNKMNAIGPQNQKMLDKYLRNDKFKLPPRPIQDKVVPLSHLYVNNNSVEHLGNTLGNVTLMTFTKSDQKPALHMSNEVLTQDTRGETTFVGPQSHQNPMRINPSISHYSSNISITQHQINNLDTLNQPKIHKKIKDFGTIKANSQRGNRSAFSNYHNTSIKTNFV